MLKQTRGHAAFVGLSSLHTSSFARARRPGYLFLFDLGEQLRLLWGTNERKRV